MLKYMVSRPRNPRALVKSGDGDMAVVAEGEGYDKCPQANGADRYLLKVPTVPQEERTKSSNYAQIETGAELGSCIKDCVIECM